METEIDFYIPALTPERNLLFLFKTDLENLFCKIYEVEDVLPSCSGNRRRTVKSIDKKLTYLSYIDFITIKKSDLFNQ